MALVRGDAVGEYTLIKPIGTGGAASVWLVSKALSAGYKNDLRYALKILTPVSREQDPSYRTRFNDEARLGILLDHENIVKVHGFGDSGGVLWLSMELVRGCSLKSVLLELRDKGATMDVPVALQLMRQILKGLDYAHHHAVEADGTPFYVIHRDLKPANILLTSTGIAKIADFGVAKATINEDVTLNANIVRGTPRYMSPEQVRAERLDQRSDLFSAGLILFELLTLEPLYEGQGDELYQKTRTADIGDRLDLVPPTQDRTELLRILRRCLAANRDDRYTTAAEIVSDLWSLLQRHKRYRDLSDWFRDASLESLKQAKDTLTSGGNSTNSGLRFRMDIPPETSRNTPQDATGVDQEPSVKSIWREAAHAVEVPRQIPQVLEPTLYQSVDDDSHERAQPDRDTSAPRWDEPTAIREPALGPGVSSALDIQEKTVPLHRQPQATVGGRLADSSTGRTVPVPQTPTAPRVESLKRALPALAALLLLIGGVWIASVILSQPVALNIVADGGAVVTPIVTLDGERLDPIPTSVRLSILSAHKLEINADGYASVTRQIQPLKRTQSVSITLIPLEKSGG